MRRLTWWAATLAALALPAPLLAQDVTLTARGGGLSIEGALTGFDGEFYRVATRYGALTVDAAAVICDGPACPDLTAPLATIRLLGAAEPGNAILPRLLETFAAAHGYRLALTAAGDGFQARLDSAEGRPLAKLGFTPTPPEEALEALRSDAAELVLATEPAPGLTARVLALDALQPIVAPDNPLPLLSTRDLARALSGEVANWAELGGPDRPLVLHALPPADGLQAALAARLGRPVAATVTHPDLASLAKAVARDPYALAITGRSAQGAARPLPLTDSCGFPLQPSPLAVKAGDYPLALPLYLLTPRRRLPLVARELLDFLATPPAQQAIAAAGYIDRAPMRAALADGARLINAIRAAEDGSLPQLHRLAEAMAGAERLSLSFRFDAEGALDPQGREALTDLARMIEIGQFRGQDIVLTGFSDGEDALARSERQAASVAAALAEAMTGPAPEETEIRSTGFGAALPMACDSTEAGRRLNRRVEVWLEPRVTGSPAP
ncbi:MAG: OmpA/MotB domain protein [Cereibacter sp.]|jgi:phosphate transport system substrate-binding protein|nr:OmpA/MotB domain protein [Cereibacter sp.]